GRGGPGDGQARRPAAQVQREDPGPPPHPVHRRSGRRAPGGRGRRAVGEPSMRMSDFVVREAIVPDLKANSKESVIREMVTSLAGAGYFRGGELEDIVKAVLKRELLGSTGIGRSVAIPHSKHSSVDRLVGTVA